MIIAFLAKTEFFFYILLWLIFLLVAGTVAQKEIGLYLAHQRYFSSFIIWIWIIPVPGGYTVLGLITLSLTIRLLLDEWVLKRLGTIVIHLGAILLLLGGFVTAEFSYEGNMVIEEGEKANYISDYHKLELSVTEVGVGNVVSFSDDLLQVGKVLIDKDLPFEIEVRQFCRNCKIVKRDDMIDDGEMRDMAKFFELREISLAKIDEENRSGVSLKILDGVYNIFEFMPIKQMVKVSGKEYVIEIRHLRTYLPFSVYLNKFTKEVYQATNKARSYESEVVLEDDGVAWPSVIKMNQPLRYKGYTFYQSSFIEGKDNDITILAVVNNMGRLFPYISSILMCIGLLIHLVQRMPRLMQK